MVSDGTGELDHYLTTLLFGAECSQVTRLAHIRVYYERWLHTCVSTARITLLYRYAIRSMTRLKRVSASRYVLDKTYSRLIFVLQDISMYEEHAN
jgi:hypothetical protein